MEYIICNQVYLPKCGLIWDLYAADLILQGRKNEPPYQILASGP